MAVKVEIARRSGAREQRWECPACGNESDPGDVRLNLMVCPLCGFHLRIGARERIAQLADPATFVERWTTLRTLDPLEFVDLETYPERVREAQARSGLTEAIVAGTATVASVPTVLTVLDFTFMGGSMGSVVGEKLWRAAEAAATMDLPLVSVCSSGGARMQEGILSLMQMAKTTCGVDLLNEAAVPFVAVLADPCTGGVLASFATLADICVAEPGARLYFSGPRVISETTREKLPPGFASAERNLELGHLDAVVPRRELREKIAAYLRLLQGGEGDGTGTAAGRARGRRTRKLAQATVGGAKALADLTRRALDGGDREAADEAEDTAAREPTS
jgi:acetyl-CoA carboxylase carboxyl transferase subunit beta